MGQQGIVPVILCGGRGSRLWPLSTPDKPKPFLRLTSAFSLLQETLLRCRTECFDAVPVVVASERHQSIVQRQAREIDQPIDLVLEPEGRDSLLAALAGTLRAAERRPDSLVLMLAADHHIPDAAAFALPVKEGAWHAERGMLVAFGIRPVQPLDCYGYILPGARIETGGVFDIARFLEKPSVEAATLLIEEGCLWNSGNFLWQTQTFQHEVASLQPVAHHAAIAAFTGKTLQSDSVLLAKAPYLAMESCSVDRGVMQKTLKGRVLPVSYRWSDVGTWGALADVLATQDDAGGRSLQADVLRSVHLHVVSRDKPIARRFPNANQLAYFVARGTAFIVEAAADLHLEAGQLHLVPQGNAAEVRNAGADDLYVLEIALN